MRSKEYKAIIASLVHIVAEKENTIKVQQGQIDANFKHIKGLIELHDELIERSARLIHEKYDLRMKLNCIVAQVDQLTEYRDDDRIYFEIPIVDLERIKRIAGKG